MSDISDPDRTTPFNASIDSLLGPMILGVCFNAFLYGLCVLQFFQYRTRSFRDQLPMQLLILWTFIVDTVHTATLCWMLWSYVVINFANLTYVFSTPWPINVTPLFIVLTSAPIQIYFAHRVWIHSRSRSLYWIIVALSFADTGMGIAATGYTFTHSYVEDLKYDIPIIPSWLALTAVCDGSISAILIYYLARRRSGFRRHEPLKNRLAGAFIESSLISSIFALVEFIVYSVLPSTNHHVILGYCIGRVYTCNLLAMVNARLKQEEEEENGIIASRENERRLEFTTFATRKRSPTEVQVKVSVREETQTVILEDEPSGMMKCSRTCTPDSEPVDLDLDQKSHET